MSFATGFGIVFTVLVVLFIAAIFLGIYFIPTIIAFRKKHKDKVPILLLNIFLGWSILGYVGALIWSVMEK